MLVRECYTEPMRDPDGNVLLDRNGEPICIPMERWVEMPDVVTPEAQAIVDAQQAQEAATLDANERTIGDALLAALLSNQQAIATLTTWRSTGPGAGTANLTAAQSSLALRQMADNQIAQARQLNGLIRLVKRSLSTADLSSALKV